MPRYHRARCASDTPGGGGRGRVPSRAAAFTLIELLVVISVMALMLTMLLPVLGSARVSAKLMMCLSNQRQIATTLHAYAADHREMLPPAMPSIKFVPTIFAVGTHGYDLRAAVRAYTTDFAAWTCPSVNAAPIDDAGNTRNLGCYGTYAYMPGRTTPDFGLVDGTPRRLDNPYVASRLTLVQDEYRDDTGGPLIYNHGNGAADVLADNPSYGGYRGTQGDGANSVFFDGHAAWTAGEQLNIVGAANDNGHRMFGVLPGL